MRAVELTRNEPSRQAGLQIPVVRRRPRRHVRLVQRRTHPPLLEDRAWERLHPCRQIRVRQHEHHAAERLGDPPRRARLGVGEIGVGAGHLDVVVHAAGLDVSHALPDKDAREFDLVFGVKSDGWFNLMRAIGDMPVAATVAFSSVAGRFGNLAQTDYSAANDLLCKLAAAMRTTRPATRAIVIDWTAWAGIGMAARGARPQVRDLAGSAMLPHEVGRPTADLEAYELYLRGRYAWQQRTRPRLEQSVGYYRQAVERDPRFALAFSGGAGLASLAGTRMPKAFEHGRRDVGLVDVFQGSPGIRLRTDAPDCCRPSRRRHASTW